MESPGRHATRLTKATCRTVRDFAALVGEQDCPVASSAVIDRGVLDRRSGFRFLDRDGRPIGPTFETERSADPRAR
jgi:hypothetical protein